MDRTCTQLHNVRSKERFIGQRGPGKKRNVFSMFGSSLESVCIRIGNFSSSLSFSFLFNSLIGECSKGGIGLGARLTWLTSRLGPGPLSCVVLVGDCSSFSSLSLSVRLRIASSSCSLGRKGVPVLL